tara:strand:+ start:462 stop:1991 length:1530 start_codon:yes stop_codon:yes gene_type:complete
MSKSRGVQFYWSQKNPSIAKKIYDQYCKENDIILDPFLGAGSSLYGIRDSKYKFIGVELNEMPYQICCFNIQSINSTLIMNLNNELDRLKSKYEKIYKHKLTNGNTLTIERVVFDNKENPQLKSISYRDSDNKLYKNDKNNELFNLYKERYLHFLMNNSQSADMLLEKNSRIAIKDEMYLSSIFSPINFHLLDLISKEISGNMKFVLGSILHLCKLTDLKSQSQFPYWIPKKDILDRNIFSSIEKKINQLSKINSTEIKKVNSFKDLQKNSPACLLFNKPIQKINTHDIPDNSIDFILTDPPYFDQVAYSEYLKIWEHFLKYTSYFKDEIIVSQRIKNTKNINNYLSLMTKAFGIIFKKLKPNSNMIIYFKDSRLDKMAAFLKVLKSVGFTFNSQEYLSSNKYTYKQNTSKKSTLYGDSVFHFSKKDINKLKTKKPKVVNNIIKEFVTNYLEKNKKASLGELLNNGLLKYLYDNNSLDLLLAKKSLLQSIEDFCAFKNDERVYVLKYKI